jgi:hypothetical protein
VLWQDCGAEALLDGTVVWASSDLDLLPGRASRVSELSLVLNDVPHGLALTLRCGETLLSANSYDLGVYLPGRQPRRARAIHALGEHLLETS